MCSVGRANQFMMNSAASALDSIVCIIQGSLRMANGHSGEGVNRGNSCPLSLHKITCGIQDKM